MIIETLVTTKNDDGTFNLAPMGPHVEQGFDQFELKPFKTSRTFLNLLHNGQGVLHLADDALLFAKAAIGNVDLSQLSTVAADQVDGLVVADACVWHEFQVDYVDQSSDRAIFKCQTVHSKSGKPWQGFNRARHAILEAAILATRVSFLPFGEVESQYRTLESAIRKTGGPRELKAFELLQRFVAEVTASPNE